MVPATLFFAGREREGHSDHRNTASSLREVSQKHWILRGEGNFSTSPSACHANGARRGLGLVNQPPTTGLGVESPIFHGRNFLTVAVLSAFLLISSAFTASGFFLSSAGSPKWASITCSSCVIRDRKAWSPASRLLRSAVLAVVAVWYASRASVKRCTCSMKAVADFVNLFIASVYIAQVGVGGVPTLFSFLHTASLIWLPQFLSRRHRAPNIVSSLALECQTAPSCVSPSRMHCSETCECARSRPAPAARGKAVAVVEYHNYDGRENAPTLKGVCAPRHRQWHPESPSSQYRRAFRARVSRHRPPRVQRFKSVVVPSGHPRRGPVRSHGPDGISESAVYVLWARGRLKFVPSKPQFSAREALPYHRLGRCLVVSHSVFN
jgi:hypothetical protein